MVGRTKSRDEVANILKPDVIVSPGYVKAGDAVNVMVTVWDLRSNSSMAFASRQPGLILLTRRFISVHSCSL